jgi:hypothetical protein
MFFMNLKDGPVVVDIPAAEEQALYGTLINAWNEPQINVGNTGHDKGKGAKYLMLPPDYEGDPPAGYVPVRSTTYNNYSLLRIIIKTRGAEDVRKGIAYLHTLKVYPLSAAASQPPTSSLMLRARHSRRFRSTTRASTPRSRGWLRKKTCRTAISRSWGSSTR